MLPVGPFFVRIAGGLPMLGITLERQRRSCDSAVVQQSGLSCPFASKRPKVSGKCRPNLWSRIHLRSAICLCTVRMSGGEGRPSPLSVCGFRRSYASLLSASELEQLYVPGIEVQSPCSSGFCGGAGHPSAESLHRQ